MEVNSFETDPTISVTFPKKIASVFISQSTPTREPDTQSRELSEPSEKRNEPDKTPSSKVVILVKIGPTFPLS